jgi:hypothetical protein
MEIVTSSSSSVHLLVRDLRTVRPIPIELDRLQDRDGLGQIRCPRCAWRPKSWSRWRCACEGTPEPSFDSCGNVWNTFATRGRCPGCQHQWRWTSCHECHEASLHEEWYDRTDEDQRQ